MLLGLDLGTTNVKALLVEPRGAVVARATAPVPIYHTGETSVEQDIEEIWSALSTALVRLAEANNLSSVQAIGVASQGGALQLLDSAGQPCGRVISWLDGRGLPFDTALMNSPGRRWLAERLGHGGSGIALGQLARLRHESPDLLRPPNQIGFVGDVVVSRLCGGRAHDASSLSIAVLLNPRLRAADPDVLAMLGLQEGQLPALVAPWQAAGPLMPGPAEEMGLPPGVPVSAAVHDQYAAALGGGVVRGGDAMIGAGTAWVLLAVEEALREPAVDAAFVCPYLIEGLYGQMLSLGNGGSSFAWAKELVGLGDADQSETDRILKAAPAGADGLRFWPFMVAGGAVGLGQGMSSRVFGLRLSHTRAHLLRAVVEGLALELGRCLALLSRHRPSVHRLVLCGGAARSSVTPQVIADVTGIPIARSAEPDTSAIGAAMIAQSLAEGSDDLARISESMAPGTDTWEPGPNTGLYRGMLEEYVTSLSGAGGAGMSR